MAIVTVPFSLRDARVADWCLDTRDALLAQDPCETFVPPAQPPWMRWTPHWIPWSEHSTYPLGLQWQVAHLESLGLTRHALALRAGLARYEPCGGPPFHVTRASDGRAMVVADGPEPKRGQFEDPQGPRTFTLDAPGAFAPVMASAPGR